MKIFKNGKKPKKTSNLIDESIDETVESSNSIEEIENDRDKIIVGNNRKIPVKNIAIIAIMVLFALVAVFSIISAKLSSGDKEIQYEADQASVEQYNSETRDNFDIMKYKEEQEALERARVEAEKRRAEEEFLLKNQQEYIELDTPSVSNQGQNIVLREPNHKKVNERLYQGSILLGNENIASPKTAQNSNNYSDSGNNNSSSYGSAGDFLQNTTFANGSASRIKNRDFLLPSGTVLNCVLRTKVVTTYEGLVSCQLAKDVYSDNGKNLLVRAGAILEGTQRKVMMQGQGRVFINWATVKDGDLVVRIDALGTDSLGASGVPAWVDTHFWKRFGNALLLTFIEDSLAIAQTHANRALSADNITVDNFGNQGSRMAEMALENSINIPPTAYINQGEVINVIIPRNVDFSNVFKNISVER